MIIDHLVKHLSDNRHLFISIENIIENLIQLWDESQSVVSHWSATVGLSTHWTHTPLLYHSWLYFSLIVSLLVFGLIGVTITDRRIALQKDLSVRHGSGPQVCNEWSDSNHCLIGCNVRSILAIVSHDMVLSVSDK